MTTLKKIISEWSLFLLFVPDFQFRKGGMEMFHLQWNNLKYFF